jgi:hypothetical protein
MVIRVFLRVNEESVSEAHEPVQRTHVDPLNDFLSGFLRLFLASLLFVGSFFLLFLFIELLFFLVLVLVLFVLHLLCILLFFYFFLFIGVFDGCIAVAI